MTVRVEKDGAVWTVIHSRPDARNAMDPESASALYHALALSEKNGLRLMSVEPSLSG